MKRDAQHDRLRSSQVCVVVDASTGNFYDGGSWSPDAAQVLDRISPDGVPYAGPAGQARWDPRCFRLHDLQRTLPTGTGDRRLSIQIVCDYEGPNDAPGIGDAPLGQPELFTARNRSTRLVDLEGRVALPQSLWRLVGAEDQRYVAALAVNWLPLPPLGRAEESSTTTQTRPPADPRGEPLTGDKVRGPRKGGPEQAYVPGAKVVVTGGQAAYKPLARPAGYVADELGNVGCWSTVLAPGATGQTIHTGREGTRISVLALRHDAHFASGDGLSGRIAFAGGDAKDVPDNFGLPALAKVTADAIDGAGRRAVKGRMVHDSSLRNAVTGVGHETGEWVPLVVVTADDVTSPEPPIVRRPPPPGGQKGVGAKGGAGGPGGAGGGPPGSAGGETSEGNFSVETALQSTQLLEDLFGFGPERPAPTNISRPGFIMVPNVGDPTRPWNVFGWNGGETNRVPAAGANTDTSGKVGATGADAPIRQAGSTGGTGAQEPGQEGAQTRDWDGEGVPCPNSTAIDVQAPGFARVQVTADGHLSMDGHRIEVVAPELLQAAIGVATAGADADRAARMGDAGPPGGIGSLTRGAAAGGSAGGLSAILGDLLSDTANVANVTIPHLGSPGGPATLGGQLALMTAQQRAIATIVRGAFGGPSYLAANLGVVHRNTKGNAPAESRIGAHWTAGRGQELRAVSAVVQVTSVLEAPEGSQITAAGHGVLEVVREHRGGGSIVDRRPLVLLDQGDGGNTGKIGGDLLADRERRFRLGADRALGAHQVHALVDSGMPQPQHPLAVGRWSPVTGLMSGNPTWGVRPDGVQVVADLEDVPDVPPDGMMAIYSRAGAFYGLAPDGTETALGGGGGGGGSGDITDVQAGSGILVANPGGPAPTVSVNFAAVQAADPYLADLAALTLSVGDLLGFDGGSLTNVAVGSDGDVLTADSGSPTGFSWQPATGGGSGDVTAVFTTAPGITGGAASGDITLDLHANLQAIAGLANTADNFLVMNGATVVLKTPSQARTSMGVSIGSQVQGWDADLDAIAALAHTKGNLIAGDGSAWTALTVGTNNKFLMADSSASSGVAWTALGATQLGVGSVTQAWDADLDAIAALSKTKGNIIVANGSTWVAVGVGANDKVLTADSSQSSGVAWKDPAAAGSITRLNADYTWSSDWHTLKTSGITVTGAQQAGLQINNSYAAGTPNDESLTALELQVEGTTRARIGTRYKNNTSRTYFQQLAGASPSMQTFFYMEQDYTTASVVAPIVDKGATVFVSQLWIPKTADPTNPPSSYAAHFIMDAGGSYPEGVPCWANTAGLWRAFVPTSGPGDPGSTTPTLADLRTWCQLLWSALSTSFGMGILTD